MTERGKVLLNLKREWFWPSEAAIILNISRQTIYKWIDRGTITPTLVCRPYKIPRAEVLKLLSPM